MVKAEHKTHGSRFAGAVRAQKAGDAAGFDRERQVGHRGFAAVAFSEVGSTYHGVNCRCQGLIKQLSHGPSSYTEFAFFALVKLILIFYVDVKYIIIIKTYTIP